ncbi:c-type cytochrome [Sedimenticola selenatireducens]|uniref:c-type cytochrome n=1 Tax=Sedimenticola selenatireducens TaxID=191960 RepID=UPI002AAB09A4|nr:c-type cytochrome [Sedimenticola selenatireducens]
MTKTVKTLSVILLMTSAMIAQADQQTAMMSGCLGCHKADAKLIGPSFQDIAKKYASQDGAIDTLAETVKAGSPGGKWGETQMPPSPAPIADIKKVIAWMLTH